MFNYKKIPDIKLVDIVKVYNNKIFKNMPKTLIEFCKGVEADDNFYSHHTNLFIGSKTVQGFREQIYDYLESIDAVEYSIEDSLHNACIQSPLAISFEKKYENGFDHVWKLKDIAYIYELASGKLWLPPHHQAKVSQYGKIPETVAETLRSYLKYVLKCKDKDFDELQLEISTLVDAGVIDDKFFHEIASKKESRIFDDKQKI